MDGFEDDDPCWLPPEDLTDEELAWGSTPNPWGVEVLRARQRREQEQWRRLADDPVPEPLVVGPSTLGTVLRALRWRHRLNQRELAAAAGVARSSIAAMEAAGEGDPRLSTVVRLTASCGLHLAVVDEEGTQLSVPFEQTAFHDAGERLLPAHLQTFSPASSTWWGHGRYERTGKPLTAPLHASRGRRKTRHRRPAPPAAGG